MCLAQGHNAVTPVRLEPAAPRFRVKHSTTEQLRPSLFTYVPLNNVLKSNVGGQLHIRFCHLLAIGVFSLGICGDIDRLICLRQESEIKYLLQVGKLNEQR